MFLSLLLFVGTMAISAWATLRVKAAYTRYSQVPAASGYNGAEAAEQILQAAGVYDVQIFEHDELLGDHYDPLHKRLVLSRENFEGRSVAALGIAAAARTYVAAFLTSLAYFLWYLLLLLLGNRRSDE